MAERLLRKHHADKYNVYSAGSHPAPRVNEGAVLALSEVGLDASDHKPMKLDDWKQQGVNFDYVITVCDDANETCPRVKGGAKVIHRGFEDPSHQSTDLPMSERMVKYRQVRDQIDEMCKNMPEVLKEHGAQ